MGQEEVRCQTAQHGLWQAQRTSRLLRKRQKEGRHQNLNHTRLACDCCGRGGQGHPHWTKNLVRRVDGGGVSAVARCRRCWVGEREGCLAPKRLLPLALLLSGSSFGSRLKIIITPPEKDGVAGDHACTTHE